MPQNTSGLMSAYDTLIEKFRSALENSNACSMRSFPSSAWSAFQFSGNGRATFRVVLLLRGLAAEKESIDVVVHVQGTFAMEQGVWRIMAANVGVSYLTLDAVKDVGRVLHKVHFDCDSPARQQHAMFHAQVSNDIDAVPAD